MPRSVFTFLQNINDPLFRDAEHEFYFWLEEEQTHTHTQTQHNTVVG